MKKIAVVFVLILAFCGCEDSSGPSLEERFSCKVDGKLFVAVEEESDNVFSQKRNLTVEYYNATASSSKYLTILATNSSNESISIGIEKVLKADTTYIIDVGSYSKNTRFDSNVQGQVTISKLDVSNKTIVGTFSFTAKERGGTQVISITEGKFNTAYISRE